MLERIYKDFKKYFHYSIISARSQLKSEVASSYLNWIWWILEPLSFMLIYTFIFGYVFNSREPFFPVFIFIGIAMWDFFNRTIMISIKIVKNNKGIVSKIYLPKYILVLTKIWVNGFKMLISFGIVLLMMTFYHVRLSWNILLFFPILSILGIITFGCSCFLLHFGVYVEDLANVMTIVLRFLFYLTGIFYNVDTKLPAPYGDFIAQWNPIAFLLQSMRKILLYAQLPNIFLLLFWGAMGTFIALRAIQLIYKNENSYVKMI